MKPRSYSFLQNRLMKFVNKFDRREGLLTGEWNILNFNALEKSSKEN